MTIFDDEPSLPKRSDGTIISLIFSTHEEKMLINSTLFGRCFWFKTPLTFKRKMIEFDRGETKMYQLVDRQYGFALNKNSVFVVYGEQPHDFPDHPNKIKFFKFF